MTFIHGKNTYIALTGGSVAVTGGTVDFSQYTDTSEIQRKADSHDTTTYGKNTHTYAGGLKDNTASASGTYDNTATTGPRALLVPLMGVDGITLIRRPEGTGSGKPQDRVTALLVSYTETNAVADMVKWAAEWQLSDDINSTPQ